MLVRSYIDTYVFPANITNCSNNYGPRQFPEKLIPLIIKNALQGEKLPIYGDGLNVRDWLYVEDHVKAIDLDVYKRQVRGFSACSPGSGKCDVSSVVPSCFSVCRTMF